jgi:NADH:ubiquinone oxidoreductase subunit K
MNARHPLLHHPSPAVALFLIAVIAGSVVIGLSVMVNLWRDR